MRKYWVGKKDGLTWCQRHPEKAKLKARRDAITKRFKKHGISQEQYEALLTRQQGVCAACGEVPITTSVKANAVSFDRFVIDHDRKCCNGEKSCGSCIRGLICTTCNVAVGMVRDSPDKLRKLAEYLESYISRTNCGSKVQTDVDCPSSGAFDHSIH